jgi:hypothetical protein
VEQEQLAKAFTERTELEYLFDDDQWLPAAIVRLQDSSSHPLHITIRLLRKPHGHSGIIHPNANDIQRRLRLKGSD